MGEVRSAVCFVCGPSVAGRVDARLVTVVGRMFSLEGRGHRVWLHVKRATRKCQRLVRRLLSVGPESAHCVGSGKMT